MYDHVQCACFAPVSQVVEFHLLSLPDHTLKARPLHPDPQRVTDRVVTSRVEWRTSDSDAGDFIIQVVAIDSDRCALFTFFPSIMQSAWYWYIVCY